MIALRRFRYTLLIILIAIAGCGGAEQSVPREFSTAPLIDPNTAAEAELRAVPGLTEALVGAIIAARPFATPGELHRIVGPVVSEAELQETYGALFVKVGLNSGAEEDYKLIPSSMSPRKLAHEFEEYRPYESIEQFRREMSKYVEDAEVDHLTRYVLLD